MKKLKKIALYSVGGIVLMFAALMVLSKVLGPPASQTAPITENEEEAYFDPQLESLRERNAELDDVYQRDEEQAGSFPVNEGDNPFAEVGELSDFDSFNANEDAFVEDGLSTQEGDFEPVENDLVVNEPEPVSTPSTDELLIDAVNDDTNAADPFAEIDQADSADTSLDEAVWGDQAPADVADTSDVIGTRNTSPGRSVSGEQLEDVRASLDGKIESLEARLHSELSRHQVELLEAQGSNVDSEALSNLQREMRLISTEMTAFREQSESLSASMDTLQEDVSNLKKQRETAQRQASRPQRPSAATLRNLYEVQRIEGGTATLIGQNTGRTFKFQQGDSVAHSGRVAAIRGDSVTLAWGDITATLSVF